MKISLVSSLILAAGFDVFFAANAQTQVSTRTSERCTTKYGDRPVTSVLTTTKTEDRDTVRKSITSTTTPTNFITPPPATTTTTITSVLTSTITLGTLTDTFSTTITTTTTIFTSSLVTATSTVTTDSTSTSTSTVTIPTSAGFIPASHTQGPAKRARGWLGQRSSPKFKTLGFKDGKPCVDPDEHPVSVICEDRVKVYSTITTYKTAKTTVTATLPVQTSTQTATTYPVTTTTIVPPDMSTTLSFVTTETTTSTSTITTTMTTTTTNTVEVGTTTTVYAACATSNLFGGNQFGIYANFYLGTLSLITANSAYDCCVACITSPGCAGTNYARPSTCYLISEPTCVQDQFAFQYNENSLAGAPGQGYIDSNGYCGYSVDLGIGP